MSTRLSEFISEIENEFSTFAESGDIDSSSIKRWIVLELKRFGNNILEMQEKVLDVKNSQSTLPENFKSLKLALKLKPIGSILEDSTQEDLRQSFSYTKRLEREAYFNDVTLEYVASNKTKIIEEAIILGTGKAKLYYHPEVLHVVKGFSGGGVALDCLNISKEIRNKASNQISINNSTLDTNFSEGQVYIQFYGLNTDEDGEIVIPELMHLETYLEYFCKSRIAEKLIANNRNPQALGQLLPTYLQKAETNFSRAMTASKMSAISNGNWVNASRVQNRKQSNRFNFRRYR
jgi:hypothetical protein